MTRSFPTWVTTRSSAGPGDDVFFINPGPDPLVSDSSGFNTLNFSIAALGITLDLSQNSGQTQIVDSNGDVVRLTGTFDGYVGSPSGDNVTGNNDDDLIYGGAGNNTITGGSGNNSIMGGTGNDIIYGGTGQHHDHERRRPRLDRRRHRQ